MMADDCEEERHLHHHHLQRNKQQTAVAVATTQQKHQQQQHLFVGSSSSGGGNDNGPVAPFQFIVHEQAKSMVAIQELQQDVGSLLLFRQAVLAALPHLQQQQQAMRPVQQQQQQSWARRKHVQGNSRSLEDDSTTTTTTGATNHHVADSGFSTEASNNSNTSPRSSRFDAAPMGLQGLETNLHLPPPPPPPVEKELVQHLERVQQRLARLRKDEDRLLTLLNPMRPRLASNPSASATATEEEEDELMRLLDQIQIQSSALKLAANANVNIEQQQDKKKQEVTDVCPPASPPPPPPSVRGASPTASPLPPTTGASAAASATKSSGPGKTLTREQVSAVLRLTNPVQLQRHLLRALLDNQGLKEEAETYRADSAARDARWRASSRKSLQQVTALRDENDDLRFQLEERTIELEGTKAQLRMVSQNQRLAAAASAMASPPALTSVRVRAASSQTDVTKVTSTSSMAVGVSCRQQGTQTETYERSPLPRVVDVSPKPTKPPLVLQTTPTTTTAKSPNGAAVVGSLGSWATGDEDERPSVERRSYSSRIPTPIKPLKTATTPVTSLLVSSPTPPTSTAKRELPDTPNRTHQLIAKSHHHQGRYISPIERKVRLTSSLVGGRKLSKNLHSRLALTDSSLSSTEMDHQQGTAASSSSTSVLTADYYDSINQQSKHNNNMNNKMMMLENSPVDSLERSLPSHDDYNYRRVSYSTTTATASSSNASSPLSSSHQFK